MARRVRGLGASRTRRFRDGHLSLFGG